MAFFSISDNEIKDPLYKAIKNREYWQNQDYHDYIENLYERTKLYLDKDLPQKASEHFHARFWEMYLCDALLSQNKNLVKRSNRKHQESKGPDLLIQKKNQKIWIEAVTVGSGTGENEVIIKDLEEAQTVPEDQIKLRLTSAINNKQQKFKEYQNQGIIGENDITLIALNGKNVRLSVTDQTVPRIVRCLFGIGDLTFSFDRSSNSFTDSYYQENSFTQNPNREEIRFDNFLKDKYSHISGILYSIVDIFNMPNVVGNDLTAVYNPKALNRLQLNFISVGQEYYLEGDELKNQTHY